MTPRRASLDGVHGLPSHQDHAYIRGSTDQGRLTTLGTLERNSGLQEFGEWDRNGILCRQWRQSVFKALFINLNGLTTYLCPCISLGQITHRLGLHRFYEIVFLTGIWYLVAVTFGCFLERNWVVHAIGAIASFLLLIFVTSLRLRIRRLFSIPGSFVQDFCTVFWCGWCAVAQMAIHVQAYETRTCAFGPRDVLAGYKE